MTQILVVKPDTLNARDKAKLRRAGVVTVEAERPEDVRLIAAEGPALGHNDMLYAAMTALSKDRYSGNTQELFVKLMAELMADQRILDAP